MARGEGAHSEEEAVVGILFLRMVVQCSAELTQELDIPVGFTVIGRIFIIDIQSIEAVVL